MSVQERLRLLKAELKSAAYAYETTVRRWRTNSLRGKSSERKGLSTKASLEKRDDIVKRWGLAIERIEIELERMERAIKAVDAASWPARKEFAWNLVVGVGPLADMIISPVEEHSVVKRAKEE